MDGEPRPAARKLVFFAQDVSDTSTVKRAEAFVSEGFDLVMQFVKMEKDFIGRLAVLARQQKGENSTLVYLEVDAADQDCFGGEIIMANGRKAGSVTSGAFGPITKKSLAFGLVGRDHAAPGTELHISILGELRNARVLEKPVRDPENLRLKA